MGGQHKFKGRGRPTVDRYLHRCRIRVEERDHSTGGIRGVIENDGRCRGLAACTRFK